jgi:hypothetical protein
MLRRTAATSISRGSERMFFGTRSSSETFLSVEKLFILKEGRVQIYKTNPHKVERVTRGRENHR